MPSQKTPLNTEGLAERIEADCGQILFLMKKTGRLLWRGISPNSNAPKYSSAFLGGVPHNRLPTTSSILLQQIYDNYLNKVGIVAKRENSIFVTCAKEQANAYGTAFIIFPKDNFQYCWTPENSDVILGYEIVREKKVIAIYKDCIQQHQYLHKPLPTALIDSEVIKEDPEVAYNEFLQNFCQMTFSELVAELHRVDCPEARTLTLDQLTNTLAIKYEYNPINTNLEQAMTNDTEILIHGEYYAVNSKYALQLLPLLGLKYRY